MAGRTWQRRLGWLLVLGAGGCASCPRLPAGELGGVDQRVDSGAPDATAANDAGVHADASVADSAQPDAAVWDGAAPDAGQPDAAPFPWEGIYAVTGQEPRHGAYTGTAEVRARLEGGYQVVHTQEWSTARLDGDRVALAWEGTLQVDARGAELAVVLDRVGFITRVGSDIRDPAAAAPVTLVSAPVRVRPDQVRWELAEPGQAAAFSETWTWNRVPGAEPHWRNLRQEVPAHGPIPETERAGMFALFASFHERPDVQPYVSRPEFQAAIHSVVVDPTDADYYRQDRGVVRVIQHVPDAISVVEARRRARAYGQTLAEKAAFFEEEMPAKFLSEAGLFSDYVPGTAGSPYAPSGDGMLWTGVYAASQAMRYLVTQDAEALDHLKRALEGQLLCHDITGVPGDFARTVRLHVEDTDPRWVRGTGAYAAYDWLTGANNDMLRGYWTSLPWAYRALTLAGGEDALLARLGALAQDLYQHFPLCQVTGLGDVQHASNRLSATGLVYLYGRDPLRLLEYQGLFSTVQQQYIDEYTGSRYEYGISDWSGNHLGIQGLLCLWVLADTLADSNPLFAQQRQQLAENARHALERLRSTRLGLYQLIAATLGDFSTPPPEQAEALWVLREFPAPKLSHDLDWSVNPAFCVDPFPSLPWKNDWTTVDRVSSLRAYPLFERNVENFQWKSNPGAFRSGAGGEERGGPDYLFAYWFARLFHLLDAQE